MIFTGFKDTNQDRLFPHCAGGFELTIGANRYQAEEEEEAVEDEDKEEEEAAATILSQNGWLTGMLYEASDLVISNGSHKKLKFLSDKKWKQCSNGWVVEIRVF